VKRPALYSSDGSAQFVFSASKTPQHLGHKGATSSVAVPPKRDGCALVSNVGRRFSRFGSTATANRRSPSKDDGRRHPPGGLRLTLFLRGALAGSGTRLRKKRDAGLKQGCELLP